jgi:HlyD family secretion protein
MSDRRARSQAGRSRRKGRRTGLWAFGAILVILLAAGGGYVYWQRYAAPADEVEEAKLATAVAQRSDIMVAVDGSGTLVPSDEVELGFGSTGYVAEVLVAVGERVEAGDVLARLETEELETALLEADLKVRQARLSLSELMEEPAETDIADAEHAISSAQDALTVALLAHDAAQNSNLDAAVRAREIQFQYNVDLFYATEAGAGGSEKDQARLADAWASWTSSEADLAEARQLADNEQLEKWNHVDQAANNVAQAEEKLRLLQEGASEEAILKAELSVAQAELTLQEAQAALESAVLVAPVAGTVTSVDAQVGERVTTAPIVTVAILDEPLLQLWVEEQDMGGISAGNALEITFEALPDLVYAGEIVRIDPALVTVGQTLAAQAWAKVDVAAGPSHLLGGMRADVVVVSARADDAVRVPIQALREIAPGSYGVFVVLDNGELELRLVQVGIQDFVNAEIVSGLEAGETVSLGEQVSGGAESGASGEAPADGPEPPGPGGPGGGLGRMLGG